MRNDLLDNGGFLKKITTERLASLLACFFKISRHLAFFYLENVKISNIGNFYNRKLLIWVKKF